MKKYPYDKKNKVKIINKSIKSVIKINMMVIYSQTYNIYWSFLFKNQKNRIVVVITQIIKIKIYFNYVLFNLNSLKNFLLLLYFNNF